MTNKPYSLTCAVLCLLFSAIVTPAFGLGDPMEDSSNWTTYEYDGSYLPITDSNDLWAEHDLGHVEADVLTPHLQTDVIGAPNPILGDYCLLFHDVTSQMRYKADELIVFDFDTGATMEMRFLNHFGTVNQAAYISMGDATQNQDVSLQFRNGPDRFVIYDGSNDITYNYGAGDSELTVTDGFVIVRATVLGDVVNIYLNNDLTPIITTTQVRGGEHQANGIGFGAFGIVAEIDYARWTTAGAFAPIPEPATMVLLTLGGLTVLRKRR